MSEWYLVYCKARQEDAAALGLEEQGYNVYLPKVRIKRRRPGGAVYVDEPLFPRYLFVAVNPDDQSVSPVQYTRGVQKLVKFGHYLLPVSTDVVDAIREREDPETGFHRLEMPGLKVGDQVQMRSGAFAGLEGVFKTRSGKERVIVLLSILGQQVQAEVPIGELAR